MAFANTIAGRVANGTPAPVKAGLFKRAAAALIEARHRQADMEVARVLGSAQIGEMRGGALTVARPRTGGPVSRAVNGLLSVIDQTRALRREMYARFPVIEA